MSSIVVVVDHWSSSSRRRLSVVRLHGLIGRHWCHQLSSLYIVGLHRLIVRRPSSVFVVSSAHHRSSSSCHQSVVGLCRLLVSLLVGCQSSLPSCLICRRRIISHAIHQSSAFVVIGRHRFVVSLVIINHRHPVGRQLSSPCRSVIGLSVIIGLHCLIVDLLWSSSGIISQSSVLVGLCCLSMSSTIIVCCVVVWSPSESVVDRRLWSPIRVRHLWSSVICSRTSFVVIHRLWSSIVCSRPSSVVVCGCLSSVICCLWLSRVDCLPLTMVIHHPSTIVCGHLSIVVFGQPLSVVDRRPSTVVALLESVICGRPSTINHCRLSSVVCHLWSSVNRHLWSVIVHCQSSLPRHLISQLSVRLSSSLIGLRHLVVGWSVGRQWSSVVVSHPQSSPVIVHIVVSLPYLEKG